METKPAVSGTETPATDDTELTVRAVREQLPVLRAVASTLAMHADFNLDAIFDFELAVDEACSAMLLRVSGGDAVLYSRFTRTDDELRFSATTTTEDSTGVDTTTFGWRILETLTDTLSARVEPAGTGIYLIHFELTKRRQVSA